MTLRKPIVLNSTGQVSELPSSDSLDMNDELIENIKGATFKQEINNGNSGSNTTINWFQGNRHSLTLTANSIVNFTHPSSGVGNFLLKLIQDGTGSRTANFPSVLWPGGTPATLSTAPGAVDLLSVYFDGTNYYGQMGLNFS